MIPVLKVSRMRQIDSDTIGDNVTLGYSYMLKAGMGLLNLAREMVPDNRSGEIAIICGKGNNGGDGYVAGRMLIDAGYKVMCFSLYNTEELKGECKIAFNEYISQKGNHLVISDPADLSNLSRYKLIIDAMLGTGLQGDPHGLCAMAIEAVNISGVPVLAADTPSGLNNDTGIPGNPCIKAAVTVTMGYPKIGLYFYPGRLNAGKVVVQDLGYPEEVVGEKKNWLCFPELEDMAGFFPKRHPAGSKYDHGVVLMLCGSRGMTGAATLAAESALRTGCGMVHLASPESLIPLLSVKLTETVLHPVNETGSGTAAFSAIDQIKELSINKQALCVGPGLSHHDQTSRLVREIIKTIPLPTVLDADGINAFKNYTEELGNHAGDLLITPHRGEWHRLFGSLPEDPAEIVETLKRKAREYQMTILMKGAPVIIAGYDGSAYILPFGNSALATAGTGDVLSGVILSLMAQGLPVISSAILGNYIQAEAGTLASKHYGEHSVIATDVMGNIFRVIRSISYNKPVLKHKPVQSV